jgi:hypothetical protein
MTNSPASSRSIRPLLAHDLLRRHSKIDSGEEMSRMIAMFREHGMGNFQNLRMKPPPSLA